MTDVRIPVEELISFPTSFAFKVIGNHTLDFARSAYEAVRRVLGEGRKVALRTRLSRNGTYISVTLTATVHSGDELRAVYAVLWKVDGAITVL